MLLSLDLSTSTGWAVMDGEKIVKYGTIIHKSSQQQNHPSYPFNMIFVANQIAQDILKVKAEYDTKYVVIEETNQGSLNRYSQKQIEFIHFAVASALEGIPLYYYSTSKWKSQINIRFSKEDREHNKMVKAGNAKGKITNKHLTVKKINKVYNLELKLKDNDIADAIAIASAFLTKEGIIPQSKWEI
jgi:Holliday junction resolvasome RuvABC endonuclease subunit